jgi:hypothetical protein
VALAIVSRPRVVTRSNPSPEFQFLDTSWARSRFLNTSLVALDGPLDGFLKFLGWARFL